MLVWCSRDARVVLMRCLCGTHVMLVWCSRDASVVHARCLCGAHVMLVWCSCYARVVLARCLCCARTMPLRDALVVLMQCSSGARMMPVWCFRCWMGVYFVIVLSLLPCIIIHPVLGRVNTATFQLKHDTCINHTKHVYQLASVWTWSQVVSIAVLLLASYLDRVSRNGEDSLPTPCTRESYYSIRLGLLLCTCAMPIIAPTVINTSRARTRTKY